ncbi:MAG TPA: GGDEF domain-containing protein [Xanthomonadales bacterium]|nr:GGDEF domain-containing protein [Xanthomonadales bacterium]
MARTIMAALLLAAACAAVAACPNAPARARLLERATQSQGLPSESAAWERVADAARECGDAPAQADALARLAVLARSEESLDHVVALETERAALAARHTLTQHEADAQLDLGRALIAQGEMDRARTALDIARARYEALGSRVDEAAARSELSRLERRRGDYLAALRHELAALDLRKRFAPEAALSPSLLSLATLYEQIELFEQARQYYAEALREAERGGERSEIIDALIGYSGFLNDFGGEDSRQALPMAQRAIEVIGTDGEQVRLGSALLQVGRASFALGRYDDAEAAYRRTVEVADRTGTHALRAHVDFRWGELDFARGDLQSALARIEAARAEYEREGNRHRLIKVEGVLEKLYDALGDPLASARAGREHYRLRNEILGVNAIGRLGELLTNFALSEEKHRSEQLEQANAVAALRLQDEQRTRLAGFAIAAFVLIALAVLAWRHASVQRLNRVLREQTREIAEQGRLLASANDELREKSERLSVLSITDSLTGLNTRAHGIERLCDMIATHRELGTNPALLVIDVDHFKEVNDHYGHPAGDSVLFAVAEQLRELVPADSVLARLGGEEFMVAIPDDASQRAHVLADTLRRRVRDVRVDVGPKIVGVTISVGHCAIGETKDRSVRELFACADEALYAAKHAGRDCVRGYRAATA